MIIFALLALIAAVVIGGVSIFILYFVISQVLKAFVTDSMVRGLINSVFLTVTMIVMFVYSHQSCAYGEAAKREALKVSNLNYTVGGDSILFGWFLLFTGFIAGLFAFVALIAGAPDQPKK